MEIAKAKWVSSEREREEKREMTWGVYYIYLSMRKYCTQNTNNVHVFSHSIHVYMYFYINSYLPIDYSSYFIMTIVRMGHTEFLYRYKYIYLYIRMYVCMYVY